MLVFFPSSDGDAQMAMIGIQRKKIAGGAGNNHFLEVSNRLCDEAAGHGEFTAAIGGNKFRAAPKAFLCPQGIPKPLAVVFFITIRCFYPFGCKEPLIENAIAEGASNNDEIDGCDECESAKCSHNF